MQRPTGRVSINERLVPYGTALLELIVFGNRDALATHRVFGSLQVSAEKWAAGWEAIDHVKYQSLGDDERNRLLIFMASHSLSNLDRYEMPKKVAYDSISACVRYMADRSVDARSISIYLNHTNPNLDLSAQYSFIGTDKAAHDSLDIICFATGAVARTAYLDQRLGNPPDPVILATTSVTVEALEKFMSMLRI